MGVDPKNAALDDQRMDRALARIAMSTLLVAIIVTGTLLPILLTRRCPPILAATTRDCGVRAKPLIRAVHPSVVTPVFSLDINPGSQPADGVVECYALVIGISDYTK